MKYSKSDSAYFSNSKKVNSIKGGKLREDGILENSDFSNKNRNNVVRPPIHKFKTGINNTSFELKNMNEMTVEKPIKLMVQKGTGETFIFFGYNPETETYHLVCYNNPDASNLHNNLIKCERLEISSNGSRKIVKLSHADFLNIGIEELIILCYHFLLIRKENHGFMNRLFEYLDMFVFEKVVRDLSSNSNDMVEQIKMMLKEEGINRFNQQHGGKLDVDGKLDTDDFNLYRF